MNIQSARVKAEEITRCICSDLDYDLKVEEKTSLLSKDIIAGNGVINYVESRLVISIMHKEKIKDKVKDLKELIDECVRSYLLEERLAEIELVLFGNKRSD